MKIEWNKNLKQAPYVEPILLLVNHGLFSGGWQWHKALRVRDKFFNYETKNVIDDPHSWASVER